MKDKLLCKGCGKPVKSRDHYEGADYWHMPCLMKATEALREKKEESK